MLVKVATGEIKLVLYVKELCSKLIMKTEFIFITKSNIDLEVFPL